MFYETTVVVRFCTLGLVLEDRNIFDWRETGPQQKPPKNCYSS